MEIISYGPRIAVGVPSFPKGGPLWVNPFLKWRVLVPAMHFPSNRRDPIIEAFNGIEMILWYSRIT